MTAERRIVWEERLAIAAVACLLGALPAFYLGKREAAQLAPAAPLPAAAGRPLDEPRVTLAADAQTVYVTRTGAKYHRATCQHARSGTPVSEDDARARGLEPCRRCKP